jgi:hypothetical protein
MMAIPRLTHLVPLALLAVLLALHPVAQASSQQPCQPDAREAVEIVNEAHTYMRAYRPDIPVRIQLNRVDGPWASLTVSPLDPNRTDSALVIFARAEAGD